MKSSYRLKVAALGAAVMALLFGAGMSYSNGEDFFESAIHPGPDPLVYTGVVKDTDGKPVPYADVILTVARLGIRLERPTLEDGSYSTYDVVKALKMIGENPKPEQMEIFVQHVGYRQLSPASKAVPNQARGRIQIDFVMAPDK